MMSAARLLHLGSTWPPSAKGSGMNRLTIAEAGRDFAGLVGRICSEGVGVELQEGDNVVAYLTPASLKSALKIRDLAAFLRRLPKLEDDADAFSADLRPLS
jgi:hypothetical protein